MAVRTEAAAPAKPVLLPAPSFRRATKLVHRNMIFYKHYWAAVFTAFFEPLFYLGAVGFGVGQFVGSIQYKGIEISFAEFLAPGMLAASTLNGAIMDGFFSPFFRLNWRNTYEAILATPLNVPDITFGEQLWAQLRGAIYSTGFIACMLVLGVIDSWWGLLLLPAAMLSTATLSAGAMILTGFAKEISSLEKVMTLVFFPLFLFSGTFFPVSVYPDFLHPVVVATPLYHSASLLRSLSTGQVGLDSLVNVVYLIAMFVVANVVAIRLMRKRMIT